jgi:hypothetical protein
MKATIATTLTTGALLAFIGMSLLTIGLSYAASSSSNSLTANVDVSNVIYLSVAPTAISFNSLFPGGHYDTNVIVTDSDINGNIGANILVDGSPWTSNSNSMGVGNTIWSSTSETSNVGNSLESAFANTLITIPAPSLSTPSTSGNVYLGVNIPLGTPPGNYLQTINFENYNASQSIYNQTSTANSITASVAVNPICYISLASTAISFGSIKSGSSRATNAIVTDSDTGGNAAASLLVGGTNWALTGSNSISFGVSNTLYDAAAQPTYIGTALTNNLVDTSITIPAPTQSNTITSNSIYFGLGIPGGAPAGSYTQTITIENSC